MALTELDFSESLQSLMNALASRALVPWKPNQACKRGPDLKAIQTELMDARTRSKSISGAYRNLSQNACTADGGISLSRIDRSTSDGCCIQN